ncbi:hypothetical protein [Actinoplanes sp. HUAS TT8]|uniref:hypothetical protein n=1 Tax=Actinoplanes sp. HUAS TT8 TaxID=3447453 RepID=UPI003F5205C7
MASGGNAPRAFDAELLRISKATKSELDFYGEGVHIVTATSRTLQELQHQASADRLALASSFLVAGQRFMRLRGAGPEYRSAISRFYYAMYHAARAVVYHVFGGDDHESHSKLPTKLPRDFVNAAVWTNDLKDARSRRNAADYDPYPMDNASWQSIANSLSVKAAQFLVVARQYLKRKGCAYV